jgi:IS30 family transposase
MKYRHLSIEEREQIQLGVWEKKSVRSIAEELGRSPASVSREIRRNLPPQRYQYTPRLAHERALLHRHSRGRTERLKNDNIRIYVVSHLKRRWSPEQISGRIYRDIGEHISPEAIYQFIYAQIHRHGHGNVKPGCEDLRPFLRRRRKRRIPKGARQCQRVSRSSGVSIDLRPAVVAERSRVGDWEGDTVESCGHKPGVNTVVERKTGLLLMTKLAGKTSAATVAALTKRFAPLPPVLKQTVTLDNGPENSDWQEIEQTTGLSCYRAHPSCSWERGTNENTNGLVRDYYPKGTDFTTIPEEELACVERELNNRPRKRLGWRTPLEAMGVALQG